MRLGLLNIQKLECNASLRMQMVPSTGLASGLGSRAPPASGMAMSKHRIIQSSPTHRSPCTRRPSPVRCFVFAATPDRAACAQRTRTGATPPAAGYRRHTASLSSFLIRQYQAPTLEARGLGLTGISGRQTHRTIAAAPYTTIDTVSFVVFRARCRRYGVRVLPGARRRRLWRAPSPTLGSGEEGAETPPPVNSQ